MKILIHSNAPWTPTGYGRQTKYLALQLKQLGHQVAISAFYGLSGAPITWEDLMVYPAGQAPYGTDVLPHHAADFQADVIITLMDFWKLAPCADALRDFHVLAWLPVDCTPLGAPDRDTLLRSGAEPLAMSHFGQRQLYQAGFTGAQYIPHTVDLNAFAPPADRKALRTELGVDEFFLIGICAANSDAFRKAWPEQFAAFKAFAARHDEARLMVHSVARSSNGFALDQLAQDIGIADKVIFSDQYPQVAGLMGDDAMAGWFGCLDVLSACSYAEGFGLPIVEAQACGTPVIATSGSAMIDVNHVLHVEGTPWWNPVHRAWWTRPDAEEIEFQYQFVYDGLHVEPAEIRRRVLPFGLERNAERWKTLLRRVERGGREAAEPDGTPAYSEDDPMAEAIAQAWRTGAEDMG